MRSFAGHWALLRNREDEHLFWSSGRCSALRAYASCLSDSIVTFVTKCETADAFEFDTYLEIDGFLADELEAVLYELLKV
jgi:hypothetical protein